MVILKNSQLTNYFRRYESIYPGIEIWFQRRVEPDMAAGIKIMYRFDKNYDIAGIGIIDIIQGKLCHLSIEHAIRGSGIGRSILNLATRDIKNHGHDKIWCHAPENIVTRFSEWSTAKSVSTLGNFGRPGMRDVKMTIQI